MAPCRGRLADRSSLPCCLLTRGVSPPPFLAGLPRSHVVQLPPSGGHHVQPAALHFFGVQGGEQSGRLPDSITKGNAGPEPQGLAARAPSPPAVPSPATIFPPPHHQRRLAQLHAGDAVAAGHGEGHQAEVATLRGAVVQHPDGQVGGGGAGHDAVRHGQAARRQAAAQLLEGLLRGAGCGKVAREPGQAGIGSEALIRC